MTDYRVTAAVCSVRSQPSIDSVCVSEALYGERLALLEARGSWIKARQLHDGYVGFVRLADLEPCPLSHAASMTTTHWVQARSTLLFREPNIKSEIVVRIPFAAELTLLDQINASFSRTDCGYFVWSAHCQLIAHNHDGCPLELAQSHFTGTPYVWGGRSPMGADCSGLVQLLARSKGIYLPRDCIDQEPAIGTIVHPDDYQARDLVYWPGHTGILLSSTEIFHCTAYTLSSCIEPLDDVIKRAGPITSVRRVFQPIGQ